VITDDGSDARRGKAIAAPSFPRDAGRATGGEEMLAVPAKRERSEPRRGLA
jgi:hypothetical protein